MKDYKNEVMEMVKLNSARAMTEAFAVLDGIKENTISLPESMEMSNALGKANAAIGNIIKAELVSLACEKRLKGESQERIES